MPILLWLMHVAPIGTSVTLLFQMSSDNVFSWLKDIGLALTWKIYHDMFGHFLNSLSLSQPQGQWKLWLQGSKQQSPGLPTGGMAHGRNTAFHIVHMQQHPPFCLHLPWPSVSPPTPSPQHLFLLPTFSFPSNIFPLPFSPSSCLLFRQLAACSYLLAMFPVNPKDSLSLLSKETSFHRNKWQLLFISYKRQKGLASLWEPAAHFLTLLPAQKSGSQHTAGDTHGTQLLSK